MKYFLLLSLLSFSVFSMENEVDNNDWQDDIFEFEQQEAQQDDIPSQNSSNSSEDEHIIDQVPFGSWSNR